MIQSIHLKKLVQSPRNVRKSSDVLADLQLRADIAARGLLQNLVVRKAKRGKFEVEAGGRQAGLIKVNCRQPPRLSGDDVPIHDALLGSKYRDLGLVGHIVYVNAVQRWGFQHVRVV